MKNLENDLRAAIQGEVRFDPGTRAIYSTDASNYRQVPIGVVLPRTLEDVVKTHEIARTHSAPVLSRGGGTSLAGQCCNVAIVMDFSKYLNRVLNIDPVERIGDVEPGTILDDLRSAAENHHLTFGPDPASHSRCTIGGMIGNNSCGVHSVYSGKTEDNVHEMDVLTYRGLRLSVGKTSEQELQSIMSKGGPRGEIYSKLKDLRDRYQDLIRARFPKIPRRVSGYNLTQLLPEKGFDVARALVGTEGTCVTVLRARLHLVHSPPYRRLIVLGFRDMATAADHLMEILSYKPLAVEGVDDDLVESMKRKNLHPENVALLPPGGGWLLVEFGGETSEEALERAQIATKGLSRISDAPQIKLCKDDNEARMMWRVRESALGATASAPGEKLNWEGWEDSAVPPEKMGPYLRELRALMSRYDYHGGLYGHLGDGCVHTRIDFDLQTPQGIQKFRQFMSEAADLVVSFGGSLSGEHGDGQSRAELLHKMFGHELVEAFREFKRIWDPDAKMNPGKVVDPYRLDDNLKMASFVSSPVKTHFPFAADRNFSNTTLRCVGVGECRQLNVGTMCPSFQVTREEMHSTRGRARILFEMLNGETVRDGWKSEEVKEALSLCLSCKACRSDCPVGVDMATYKAEFLSHYYEGRIRPASAYAMGLIFWWSRLGALLPTITNFFSQTDPFARWMKALIGVAPERKIPSFAKQTFRQWFKSHKPPLKTSGSRILLWIDTFHNFYYPEIAQASVEALESIGFEVVIPSRILCCGRPLYEYGMLDCAKKVLTRTVSAVSNEFGDDIPMVGLEPGCLSVFRDEIINLFPGNEDAEKLRARTFLLSEFLHSQNVELPTLNRKAIVHLHCHQRSVAGIKTEEAILKKLGLDFQILDSGCCGMAGSFGFEKDHYDVSIRCAERVLAPAVREAHEDTLVLTNGFSCREQLLQRTGKRPLHLGEVIKMAFKKNV
ncbi:FAD-binding protein [bacterium]|nr:FAD-binding protein [bacterium]